MRGGWNSCARLKTGNRIEPPRRKDAKKIKFIKFVFDFLASSRLGGSFFYFLSLRTIKQDEV
jgi:hypothetical protein